MPGTGSKFTEEVAPVLSDRMQESKCRLTFYVSGCLSTMVPLPEGSSSSMLSAPYSPTLTLSCLELSSRILFSAKLSLIPVVV